MWRRQEPLPLDRETADGIISLVMRIDANVQLIVDALGVGEDGEEETGS
jgi:hypothetical protein